MTNVCNRSMGLLWSCMLLYFQPKYWSGQELQCYSYPEKGKVEWLSVWSSLEVGNEHQLHESLILGYMNTLEGKGHKWHFDTWKLNGWCHCNGTLQTWSMGGPASWKCVSTIESPNLHKICICEKMNFFAVGNFMFLNADLKSTQNSTVHTCVTHQNRTSGYWVVWLISLANYAN